MIRFRPNLDINDTNFGRNSLNLHDKSRGIKVQRATCASWHQWPEAWPNPWPTSLITRNGLPFAAVCRPFVDPIACWQWKLYSSKYYNENSSMQEHRNKGRQSINQPWETSSPIFFAWSFCNFVSAKPRGVSCYRQTIDKAQRHLVITLPLLSLINRIIMFSTIYRNLWFIITEVMR